ncbi:MAG: thioesterase family protein [Actinobacteria bacterium]|nr:thioesterase family protein [Actinomycetota bacterium]
MDAVEFLGLQPTHNPNRWILPIVPGIATAGRFLFGGCGLGAAITALEKTTGRPVVWATGQYLSYATVGEIMDIDVEVVTAGHFTSQARVVCHVAEREILSVTAALGARPLEYSGQFNTMPEVRNPEDSPVRISRWDVADTIMERLDIRIAQGRQWEELDGTPSEDGRCALWVRLNGAKMSAAVLAVLGDYVPYGIAQAMGRWTRSNSLDNTMRMLNVVPTEWVLLDVRIHGVRGGFGHGLVHLWAEDGTLMATASQTAIVRELDTNDPEYVAIVEGIRHDGGE